MERYGTYSLRKTAKQPLPDHPVINSASFVSISHALFSFQNFIRYPIFYGEVLLKPQRPITISPCILSSMCY